MDNIIESIMLQTAAVVNDATLVSSPRQHLNAHKQEQGETREQRRTVKPSGTSTHQLGNRLLHFDAQYAYKSSH